MDVGQITGEKMAVAFAHFLSEQLRASFKEKLMEVAEREVEDVLDRAAGQFEVAVKTYMEQEHMRHVIAYGFRRIDKEPACSTRR